MPEVIGDLFAWLPVETLVKARQEECYNALSGSDEQADSASFVVFMLRMISAAFDEALEGQLHDGTNDGINVGMTNEVVEKQEHVLSLVRESPSITIAQMA